MRDKNALRKIADAASISSGDTILEIGPGEGDLTRELLLCGAKVIAVEKDRRLIPILEEKFSEEISSGRLVIIEEDILKFLPSSYQLQAKSYKLVANIPYYITGELIRKALSVWPAPLACVLLLQKEVAERIVARNGKESILSISVKAYGKPSFGGVIKAGAFRPAPKVDSAILIIEGISKVNFQKIDEKTFFDLVKAGFAHKRKMLGGNLKALLGQNLENSLNACGIAAKARSEDLTLEKWLCLAENLG